MKVFIFNIMLIGNLLIYSHKYFYHRNYFSYFLASYEYLGNY